jgi:hypothetical protein
VTCVISAWLLPKPITSTSHVYEVRPRKDKRGVDLISDTLPFGRLWYDTPDHAIGYDAAGNVIETHEHTTSSESFENFNHKVRWRNSLAFARKQRNTAA